MARTDTIELLNNSDELERKMRWVEFQQEMSFLWEGGEDEWKPGDRLHKSMTNIPRYWVEELDEDLDNYAVKMVPKLWCRDCQVGWEDESKPNCWSCGADCSASITTGVGGCNCQFCSYSGALANPQMVRYSARDVQLARSLSIRNQLRNWFSEELDLERSSRFRGLSANRGIVDEWTPGGRPSGVDVDDTGILLLYPEPAEEEPLTPQEQALAWRRANGAYLADLNPPISRQRRRRNESNQ